MYALKPILAGLVISAATSASAQENFFTETGECTLAQLEKLQSQSGDFGRTFALQSTPLLTNRGATAAQTGTDLPALTPVACHAEAGDLILVSSEGDRFLCGWVRSDALLETVPRGGLFATEGTCGEVVAMPVSTYCERMAELGEQTETCLDQGLSDTVFDTKFIVDNTSLGSRSDGEDLTSVDVPLYAEAGSEDQAGTVRVFNVLRLYSVDRGPSGDLRYLLGVGNRRLLGWVDANSGGIWYSKLATFFAQGSTAEVLSGAPWIPSSAVIAQAPGNLDEVLSSPDEFQRYPVLADQREVLDSDPAAKEPYLEIAFIGAFCGEDGALCSDIVQRSPEIPDALLNSADIMFLIDGTASMETYYGLVARAVTQLTDDFQGNLDYQFGVAMYGDFNARDAVDISDPMQFRQEIALTPIFDGTEFSDLPDASLYIRDALEDKPEAANAALLRTIAETPWRSTSPKFIIHIADHGDRVPPNPTLIQSLSDNQIFYMPIAVRGSEVLPASADFVRHASQINEGHRTEGGVPLALQASITYSEDGKADEEDEYLAISRALKGAVEFGNEIRDSVIDELYDANEARSDDESAPETERFPEGFSQLTAAAIELYLGGIDGFDGTEVTERTIAARGVIATAQIGETDQQWDFYAAIQPGDLTDLARGFEDACVGIQDTDAIVPLENAIRTLIEVLTGDSITEAELPSYFSDREQIPLSTQTLLGDGLFQLVDDLNNPNASDRIKAHQRDFCRTYTLLSLMQGSSRLPDPFEERAGLQGDLIWREESATYTYRDVEVHRWIYKDAFEARTIFLPLSYLPGAQE